MLILPEDSAPCIKIKKSIRSKLVVKIMIVRVKNTPSIVPTKNFFRFLLSESIGTQSKVVAQPRKNALPNELYFHSGSHSRFNFCHQLWSES